MITWRNLGKTVNTVVSME